MKIMAPRCVSCKKLYAVKDNDGSGYCTKCRRNNGLPTKLNTTNDELGGDQEMNNEAEVQEEVKIEVDELEEDANQPSGNPDAVDAAMPEEASRDTSGNEKEQGDQELNIEDIVERGKFGVTNSQMIPALKKAIAEQSVPKLKLLKATYLYSFDASIRYLKKSEREYIAAHI